METMIVRVQNKQDIRKLKQLSESNGWQTRSINQTLNLFINSAPVNVPLSDEEIIEEIKKVRAGQVVV
jgi:ligand-binding sensor domain-containing protein